MFKKLFTSICDKAMVICKKLQAFTLVELLVVVFVIAIL